MNTFPIVRACVCAVLALWLTLFAGIRPLAAGEQEQPEVKAVLVEHGIYEATLPETGQVLSNPVLLKKTWRVPLTPGTLFGIRYALAENATQAAELEVRLIHPRPDAPAGSRETQWYDTRQSVEPGKIRFQGQHFAPGTPARPGSYLFQIRHGNKVLAEREFDVYEPEADAHNETQDAAPGSPSEAASSWLEREHGRCRALNVQNLGVGAGARTLALEHSFALHFPGLGPVCFLTLSGGKGDRYVLLDADNDVLASFDPDEPGTRTRAVSFADLDKDGLPDIVILGQRRGQTGASQPANQVWRGRSCARGLCWSTDPAASTVIAEAGTFAEAMDGLKRHEAATEAPASSP